MLYNYGTLNRHFIMAWGVLQLKIDVTVRIRLLIEVYS